MFEALSDGAWLNDYVVPWGLKVLLAVIIFLVGKWIARRLANVISRVMEKSKLDVILIKFFSDIAYWVLLVAVALAALDQLGVNVTSLLAIVGAAGLAVGLAMKDSLANFAAGVMLIIFRPFSIGDFVDAGGVSGTVESLGLFCTVMKTPDNKKIIVPNSGIFGGNIVNVSANPTRRVDLVIGIGYGDDIKKAKDIIEKIFAQDERILKDPAPVVAVGELADSSVNFNVRPWVNKDDYWAVYSDLLEKIKLEFDAQGVSIPFPQQDVHMHQVA